MAIKNDLVTQSGSFHLRIAEWKEVRGLLGDNTFFRKLIGTGPDTATFYLLAYRDPALNIKRSPEERTWRTFFILNQYLHTLVNTGIFGLLALLALTYFTIRQFLGVKKHSVLDLGYYSSFLMVVFSGLVYFETVSVSLLFWVFLPVLWKRARPIKRISLKFLPFIFITFSIFIFSYTALYATANLFVFRQDYQTATKLLPIYDMYWREWADIYASKAHETNSEVDIKKALDLSKKALTLNPLEVKNIASMQFAYYTAGNFLDKSYHQEALEMGKKRVLLAPSYADGFDALGLIYLDLGQLDEALVNFKQAITVDPDSRMSYLHIGEVYKQKGDFDHAIEYYQMAIGRFPNYHVAETELEKAKLLKEGKTNKRGFPQ